MDSRIRNIRSEVAILPAEYQQVDYLQCDGDQYIDTGVIPDRYISKVYLDYIWTNSNPRQRMILGLSESNDSAYMDCSEADGRIGTYWMSVGGTASLKSDLIFTRNTRYKSTLYMDIYNLRWYYVINDTAMGPSTYNNITFETNLFLFAYNLSGVRYVGAYYAICKCFNCKIDKMGAPLRDFYPCYRKEDHVAGMYDIVEGKFYTNQGTGNFVVGPDCAKRL